jgi:hypothetical protein
MTQHFNRPPEPEIGEAKSDQRVPERRSERAQHHRHDPRQNLDTQAFVSISAIPTRAYVVKEISRGGMFLGFRDPRSTRLELEQNGIECNTPLEIAFVVSSGDTKNRFNVSGRIRRITREGIGVAFATHNPPQLGALRDLFAHLVTDEAS